MAKETRLNLRIDDETREMIEAMAKRHHLDLSAYARSRLIRAVLQDVDEMAVLEAYRKSKKNGKNSANGVFNATKLTPN